MNEQRNLPLIARPPFDLFKAALFDVRVPYSVPVSRLTPLPKPRDSLPKLNFISLKTLPLAKAGEAQRESVAEHVTDKLVVTVPSASCESSEGIRS